MTTRRYTGSADWIKNEHSSNEKELRRNIFYMFWQEGVHWDSVTR